jgi:molybdopterin synthase catalytic subunit
MISVDIGSEPISITTLYNQIHSNSHGAVSLFLGNVRDRNNNLDVAGINYDCFAPLAKKFIKAICDEAKKEWGSDLSIVVYHRSGLVNVGEPTVAVCVSAKHRKDSMQATQYIIDELKHRAPIWKEEIYTNGTRTWLEGCQLQ